MHAQLLDRMWDADMGVPRRHRAPADEGGTARQLRSFVDTFVTEDFLPDIYVDFRRAPWPCVAPGLVPSALSYRARFDAAINIPA